jgi:acyl-CoA reductase-like NAD-dependent aldehyde dehydrogenase
LKPSILVWDKPWLCAQIDTWQYHYRSVSATEEVLASVAQADAADVEIAVHAARQAFETGPWTKTSAAEVILI